MNGEKMTFRQLSAATHIADTLTHIYLKNKNRQKAARIIQEAYKRLSVRKALFRIIIQNSAALTIQNTFREYITMMHVMHAMRAIIMRSIAARSIQNHVRRYIASKPRTLRIRTPSVQLPRSPPPLPQVERSRSVPIHLTPQDVERAARPTSARPISATSATPPPPPSLVVPF